MSADNKTSGGIGFLPLLCLLFIGLKLGGAIDWSWWWVLAPLWVPFIFMVAVGLLLIASGAGRR